MQKRSQMRLCGYGNPNIVFAGNNRPKAALWKLKPHLLRKPVRAVVDLTQNPLELRSRPLLPRKYIPVITGVPTKVRVA